eukprot:1807065-Pleurochrysis_carterae.AAC.3
MEGRQGFAVHAEKSSAATVAVTAFVQRAVNKMLSLALCRLAEWQRHWIRGYQCCHRTPDGAQPSELQRCLVNWPELHLGH